jgi:hypothetical protein
MIEPDREQLKIYSAGKMKFSYRISKARIQIDIYII